MNEIENWKNSVDELIHWFTSLWTKNVRKFHVLSCVNCKAFDRKTQLNSENYPRPNYVNQLKLENYYTTVKLTFRFLFTLFLFSLTMAKPSNTFPRVRLALFSWRLKATKQLWINFSLHDTQITTQHSWTSIFWHKFPALFQTTSFNPIFKSFRARLAIFLLLYHLLS